MQNTEDGIQPIPKKSLTGIRLVSIYAGLALTTSYLFAWVANYIGILFTGPHTFFAILTGTIVSCIVAAVTKFIFKRKAKQLPHSLLAGEVILTALIAVGFLSWYQTRDFLKILMKPVPVPSSVHVYQGRGFLFSTYVHFSAPPEVITAIIQSHQLFCPTNDSPEQIEQIQTDRMMRTSCDWWQPTMMSTPTFFMRHHESLAVQGWTEGWWVNDKTNEVYAFISG
jgi:hypothetical protein